MVIRRNDIAQRQGARAIRPVQGVDEINLSKVVPGSDIFVLAAINVGVH
jgi:hypothetical protein